MLLIATLAFSAIGCGAKTESETTEQAVEEAEVIELPTLKIGAIPDQNQSKLNRRFDELAAHIADETGLTVEYVPSVDYAAIVTGFERDEINLGWFGGLTGVQARLAVEGSEAIAHRAKDSDFLTVFVAQKELGLSGLDDVKDHTFTFGSESSTSGHLMPRHFMIEAGIDLDTDLDGAPNYSGSHDKTWKLVESGSFQTGALNFLVWEAAVAEGKVDLEKVDVFYTTPGYYDYNWTISNVDAVYGEGTKEKVKAALLSFGEAHPETMALFGDDKFVETNNDNYGAIEDVARNLDIIK